MNAPVLTLPISPATGRPVWSKADHDSARADAWGAVLAGVPPFGDTEAELQWLEIAEAEHRRCGHPLPGTVDRFPGRL